jgi:hypothetical protein
MCESTGMERQKTKSTHPGTERRGQKATQTVKANILTLKTSASLNSAVSGILHDQDLYHCRYPMKTFHHKTPYQVTMA